MLNGVEIFVSISYTVGSFRFRGDYWDELLSLLMV